MNFFLSFEEKMFTNRKLILRDRMIDTLIFPSLTEEFIRTYSHIKELGFINCQIDRLPDNIKELNIVSINLENNLFTEFPEVLLEMPKLKYINLSGNKIKNIPYDLRSLEINLNNNPLELLPNTGEIISADAESADIKTHIKYIHNHNVNIGPPEKWKIINSTHMKSCCNNLKYYTSIGNKRLNEYLRINILPKTMLKFYELLRYLKDISLPVPHNTKLFRGVPEKVVKGWTVGYNSFDYGFMSFSTNLRTAMNFGKHILVLDNSFSTRPLKCCFFHRDYGTSYHNENEVVIGPCVEFTVKEIINDDITNTKYYVISFERDDPINGPEISSDFLLVNDLLYANDLLDKFLKSDNVIIYMTNDEKKNLLLSREDVLKLQKNLKNFTNAEFELLSGWSGHLFYRFLEFLSVDIIAYEITGNIHDLIKISGNSRDKIEIQTLYDDEFVYIQIPKYNVIKYLKARDLISWIDRYGIEHKIGYNKILSHLIF